MVIGIRSNRKRRVIELPVQLYSPGVFFGGGLNRSTARDQLPVGQFFTMNNIHPTREGAGNEEPEGNGIGTSKQNATRPSTNKVQVSFPFNGVLCFVSNGNFYTMNKEDGTVTLISSGVFDTNAKVRYAEGLGSSNTPKIFLCDASGNTQPQVWDGSTLSAITAFGSNIYTEVQTSQYPSIVFKFGDRVGWLFGTQGVNEALILVSDKNNGETYSATGGASDGYFEYLNIGDELVTAGASIKKSGTTESSELPVVYTATKAFVGEEDRVLGTNRYGVFTNFARDIGAINQECVVNYLNDLYSMFAKGIGQLTAVTDELSSAVLEAGMRVNPLIKAASQNADFDQSWAMHCPDRDMIWFTMPSEQGTTATYEGYTYPETPMTLTIGYSYGIRMNSGDFQEVWYTREGPGWGWAGGSVDGRTVYLNSYFGDIYKCFDGDEYERNPDAADDHAVFTSKLEFGDVNYSGQLYNHFMISPLETHWKIATSLVANFFAIWDGAETGASSLNKVIGSADGAPLWDVALWDVARWAERQNYSVEITPPDGGRTFRGIIEWDSEVDINNTGAYTANHGVYWGMSGLVQIGDQRRRLRFR